MSIRPRLRWLALLTSTALPACAGQLPPPEAIEPPADPAIAATDTSSAPAGAPADVVLEPVGEDLPAIPARPLVATWEPASPAEGTPIAIHVRTSGGAVTERRVYAELDGRPVRMGRLGDGWFGMAPLPVGTTGAVELVVRTGAPTDSATLGRWTVQVRPRQFGATELSVAPRFTRPPDAVRARIERERELVRTVLTTSTPEWLLDGNFVRPRSTRITSPFGQRRVFNGELQSRHWGVDLAGDVGAPVRVAGSGRVAIARALYYAGNAVYIDHGHGVYSGYYHLSRMNVEEGELVQRGQVIGLVGATGRVTGPHLHWSLFIDGERQDATSVLELSVPAGGGSEDVSRGDAAAGPRPRRDR